MNIVSRVAIVAIVTIVWITQIVFCPEYVYDVNSRQIILNKSEMTYINMKGSYWQFENNVYLFYVDGGKHNIHSSTVSITTAELQNPTTRYFFDNNFNIYYTTYSVSQSTGT